MYASRGTSAAGMTGAHASANGLGGAPPTGGPTTHWTRSGSPSAAAVGGQGNAVAAHGTQPGGPTTTWNRSANNRIVAGPSWGQAGAQNTRGGVAAGQTYVWNRPGIQSGSRYAGSPTANAQRFAAMPNHNFSSFGNRNVVSVGRASMSPSYSGAGYSGGFRGGGGSGGGRVSSAPTGGGFHGGGGFRGGGGGGFHGCEGE